MKFLLIMMFFFDAKQKLSVQNLLILHRLKHWFGLEVMDFWQVVTLILRAGQQADVHQLDLVLLISNG